MASEPAVRHKAAGQPGLLTRVATRAARVRVDLPFVLLDAIFVAGAFALVLVVRFDGAVPDDYWGFFLSALPLIIIVTLAMNWVWRLYGQLWRHASVLEARRIILATMSTAAILTGVMVFGTRLVPLSVVAFGCMVYTVLAGTTRFQSRLFALRRDASDQPGLHVVVLGAGETGASLVREMQRSPQSGLIPIAILDDDPRLQGRHCLGVPVVGPISDLPKIAAKTPVHHAVLAVTDPPTELVRRAADLAESAEIPLRVLRGVAELVKSNVTLNDVRDLSIEDLLGREQVVTDLNAVHQLLSGRRVLVTGAGGSIGSEIARQVAEADPASLLVLDHDETHLHELVAGLAGPVAEERTTQLLADVRDRTVMHRLFERHRPDIVFHAAAHKHVPVLEMYPAEAVRTNVLGTVNVVDAARAVGTEHLVFISTDKAVNPSCVMGASKRLGEQIVLAKSPAPGKYCAVRFGNVFGSRGSVIPTFLRQINNGGPVTVTDHRMARYFMSIREAVQLVLQAATMSQGGDLYMLEMGEQVRIIEIARRMIRLAGKRIGDDVEITITGTRPGEKLMEELHSSDELVEPTAHPAIRRLRPHNMPLVELEDLLKQLAEAVAAGHDDHVRKHLFATTGSSAAPVSLVAEAPRMGRGEWQSLSI